MSLNKAKKYLEDVLAHKRCIPFRRYQGAVGRTTQAKNEGNPGGQGRWPVKSAEFILNLLKNAESNAEVDGAGMCKLTPDFMHQTATGVPSRRAAVPWSSAPWAAVSGGEERGSGLLGCGWCPQLLRSGAAWTRRWWRWGWCHLQQHEQKQQLGGRAHVSKGLSGGAGWCSETQLAAAAAFSTTDRRRLCCAWVLGRIAGRQLGNLVHGDVGQQAPVRRPAINAEAASQHSMLREPVPSLAAYDTSGAQRTSVLP